MFYSLHGKPTVLSNNLVVIETGGIGWQLFVSDKTSAQISASGTDATLYTYLNVREDALDLFGFATVSELEMFKMLIQVSGIGPKVALSILSSFDTDTLVSCIISGDAKTISAAQGIGLKTAQKVILELKDKVSKTSDTSISLNGLKGNSEASNDFKEALNALLVLGYPLNVATENVRKASEHASNLQDLIRLSLKNISKEKER